MSVALGAVLPRATHRVGAAAVVPASREAVWQALHAVTPRELPLTRLLLTARSVPARLLGRDPRLDADRPILEHFRDAGFRVVVEDAPRTLVAAAAGQPWRLRGGPTFSPCSLDEFAGFAAPGYAKIALSFELEGDDRRTVLRTETRVGTTDAAAARAFRRYWTAIRLGSMAIRRDILRGVRRRATRPRAGVRG